MRSVGLCSFMSMSGSLAKGGTWGVRKPAGAAHTRARVQMNSA